jgi:hypothetical protein
MEADSEKHASRDYPWKSPHVRIDWLQWAPAGPAFVIWLQGKGTLPAWLLLTACIPALRLLIAPTYRQRVRERFGALRDSLESYPFRKEHEPWSAIFVWVVLPVAVILLLRDYTIVSGDSRPAVLTACSLVREGDYDLSTLAEVYAKSGLFTVDGQMPYFCRRAERGLYSSYPLGMVPFVLPVAAAARLAGADLTCPKVHDRLEKWTAAWTAGLSLGLFFLLALHLAPLKPAWMATWMLATGSVMFTTVGQALWQHGGVIFWTLLAVLVEFRCEGQPGRTGTLVQGVACGMMLACRLSSVVLIIPFAVWVLLRAPVRAFALVAFACLAFAPWALLYASVYGTVFGPATGQLAAGNWSLGEGKRWAAILICPGRGVFVYQPWIVFGALNLFPSFRYKAGIMVRSTFPVGWAGFCVSVAVLQLALISSWQCWWGGYCWGSRLASEIIPLIALLCVSPIAVLWRTGMGKRLVLSLFLISSLMHVPAIYLRSAAWNLQVDVDHHLDKLWSWYDPPFLFPLLQRLSRPSPVN